MEETDAFPGEVYVGKAEASRELVVCDRQALSSPAGYYFGALCWDIFCEVTFQGAGEKALSAEGFLVKGMRT